MEKFEKVKQYILKNIDKTVRFNPNDDGTLIGLPYKYTVPCIDGIFNEIYYWDTYFTNKGLIESGLIELAKSNCDNISFLIQKFGYMPNGNRTYFLYRSQPPYFALMVEDIYEVTKDKVWLALMLESIKKEYSFWMSKRITVTELNKYDSNNPREEYLKVMEWLPGRKKIINDNSPAEIIGRRAFAECESGWDFSPRFDSRGNEFNPIDLNSLLYKYEMLIDKFSKELSLPMDIDYFAAASKRKEKIESLCLSKNLGVYTDYDFKNHRCGSVASCAGFWPYYCGIIDKDKIGPLKNLLLLEKTCGLSASSENGDLQWGYNKSWAPLNYVGIISLEKYGLHDDAIRIAKKFINLVADTFLSTGDLWEKYDAETGEVVTDSEYETPKMLGWTAGTYLAIYNFLESHNLFRGKLWKIK